MSTPRSKSGQEHRGASASESSQTRLRARPELETAAGQIVSLLVELGLDTFFGVPGGPAIPLFHAILTHPFATLVESRHETGACFSAMGYHRASGRTPVVVATAGPGATNLLTGVAAASTEGVPMLVLCGDVPWASTGRVLLQDIGEQGIAIERALGSVTRAQVRVSRPESAAAQVLSALHAAVRGPRPGPALAVVPLEHAAHRTASTRLITELPVPPPPPAAGETAVGVVERRLRQAKRPLLIVGAGCRPFADEVRALVDELQIPFVTTPRAKGLVSERHPASLRTSGMSASQWARRYMKAGPDVTLALGTDLDDVSTAGTPPIGPAGWLAHVDLRPEVIGRNFPTALGIVGDARSLVRALTQRFDGSPRSHDGHALCRQARLGSPFDTPEFARDEADIIAPHRVIADLQAAAPDKTVFVTDIGEHMLFALHYLTIEAPEDFVIHLGLGSMGSGIGSAVGLALASPERPVCCVAGDGGMQMLGSEILVAVEHGLPIVFAVFNDGRYNMVYHGYRLTFGREAEWSTPPMDFVQWARSMGARARRIERPGEIDRDIFREAEHGPVVLDIRQDSSIRIKGDGRVEAIRQMSMLHEASEELG